MALRMSKNQLNTSILSAFMLLVIIILTTGCGEDWKLGSWHPPEDDTPPNAIFIRDVTSPWGLAADGSHLYITDISNHSLLKFSVSDLDVLDDLVWEIGEFGATEGDFYTPMGVAVDALGNVYVADRDNARVQKFDSDGVFIAQWGTLDAVEEPWELVAPTGIAIDSDGFVYVADGDNNQIVKFTAEGVYDSHWGATGTGDGEFDQPHGLAIDAANSTLYVVDSNNGRVQVFTLAGVYQRQFGSVGDQNGQFSGPWGVVVDQTSGVYVTDRNSERVQLFNFSGDFVEILPIAETDAPLVTPAGIAILDNHIWICETTPNRVRGLEL
jgi:DNA-binding beta-propeller fold protein YncE